MIGSLFARVTHLFNVPYKLADEHQSFSTQTSPVILILIHSTNPTSVLATILITVLHNHMYLSQVRNVDSS